MLQPQRITPINASWEEPLDDFDAVNTLLLERCYFQIPEHLRNTYDQIDVSKFDTVHYLDANSDTVDRVLSWESEMTRIMNGEHIAYPVMYKSRVCVINILKRKSSGNNSVSNLEFNK